MDLADGNVSHRDIVGIEQEKASPRFLSITAPSRTFARVRRGSRSTTASKHKPITHKMSAPLHRADGSATYSANGYTVLASVNGPIEVQRRDEIAEEAAVEVHVRPASGVGGMLT